MTENGTFWLLLVPAGDAAPDCDVLAPLRASSGAEPIAGFAIEIFVSSTKDRERCSVLVSAVDSMQHPTVLRCVFGVSNDPQWCDRAATFGLPLMEARVERRGGSLTVDAEVYPRRTGGNASELARQTLIRVTGLGGRAQAERPAVKPAYWQLLATPDLARPESELVGRVLKSGPARSNVGRISTGRATVAFNANVIYPDLFRLIASRRPTAKKAGATVEARATAVWTGTAGPWAQAPGDGPAGAGRRGSPLARFPRSSAFGAPTFLFDDVDILGFRVDTTRDALAPLIERLNFHLAPQGTLPEGGTPVRDFAYRVATGTIVVELLRYGRMRSARPVPPFGTDDFMSQHELLVRLLVGRVDDDTSAARAPGLFVPSIFVDNPWSKALGRRLQGFPKQLAEFRAGEVPVDMRGRGTDGTIVPIENITAVHLVDRLGGHASAEPLLEIGCPRMVESSEFLSVLPSIVAGTAFRRSPFQQFDFTDPEFRRSFARDVMSDTFQCRRSLQVSPVDTVDMPSAWITGRIDLDNVEVAFPSGVATLRFVDSPGAPPEWRTLCRALRGASGPLGFPTGDWYRVRCSMALSVDDALAW